MTAAKEEDKQQKEQEGNDNDHFDYLSGWIDFADKFVDFQIV